MFRFNLFMFLISKGKKNKYLFIRIIFEIFILKFFIESCLKMGEDVFKGVEEG